MSRFEPHFEVLPPAQREVWPQLAPGVGSGLVLYGGTAIALRLGHRTSVDFDFFTNNPLDQQGLEQEFHFLSEATVIQSQQNTLSVVLPSADSTVKISFFWEYRERARRFPAKNLGWNCRGCVSCRSSGDEPEGDPATD